MPTSLASGSYVVKGLFTEVLLPTLPPKRGFASLYLYPKIMGNVSRRVLTNNDIIRVAWC